MIAGRDWSQVQVVGVSRLANYLKRKLEADPKLSALGVEGEVSNLRVQSSGSWNFDVKDRDAVLTCFAFPSDAATFPAVKNGDAVTVYGRVSTYEKRSSYQLIARHLEQAGIGKLYARYEELRRRLEAEGLFRESRKRPLPRFPFRVALVGSPTGEGTRDFLTQARLRAPHVAIDVVPTPVQGDVAPQIVAALARACASAPDLVVLARGGGSFEDLFVFSDERVVRAVAACGVPIVTAIGHEADVPLVDFAADHRASTPSTAAQTVLPRRDDLLRELERDRERMRRALGAHTGRARAALDRIERRSPLADPALLLASRRQRLDASAERVGRAIETRLRRLRDRLVALDHATLRRSPATYLSVRRERFEHARNRLAPAALAGIVRRRERLENVTARLTRHDPARRVPLLHERLAEIESALLRAAQRAAGRRREPLAILAARLGAANPEAPLQRGFAIVRHGGMVVRDAAQAPPGSALQIRLARGELAARVEADGAHGGEQIGLF